MNSPRSYRDRRKRRVRVIAAFVVIGIAGPIVFGAFQALGLDPGLAFLLVVVAVAAYAYARRPPRNGL